MQSTSNPNLFQFVRKQAGNFSRNINTEFKLRWAAHDFNAREQTSLFRSCLDFHLRNICANLIPYGKSAIQPPSQASLAGLNSILECLDDAKLKQVLNVLTAENQAQLNAVLTKFQIASIIYDLTGFNIVCQGVGSGRFVPAALSSFPDNADTDLKKFRLYLLTERQHAVSLRCFFSISSTFTTKVASLDGKGNLESVEFKVPPRRNIMRPSVCHFDDECLGTYVLSKTWQRRMLAAIANVWGRDTTDLDPLAMVMLLKAGVLPSVFQASVWPPYSASQNHNNKRQRLS
jgi:hypothetical protein